MSVIRIIGLGFALALSCQSGRGWAIAKAKAPVGVVTLDMTDPVITAIVNGVALRLRVGLEQKNVIELNPASVGGLGITFEPGFDADVGRTKIPGISATPPKPIMIDGRPVIALLSSHGRDCCTGVDGAISATLLPYAAVRFVRFGVAPADHVIDLIVQDDDEHGLETSVAAGKEQVFLQFSLQRADSVMTWSAGAILAQSHGGHFIGPALETIAAFGVKRPARMVAFDRPVTLAGFRFDRLPARIADFAGHYEYPRQGEEDADIVVKGHIKQQEPWPVILIGRDRLDGCTEITLDRQAHRLSLRCALAPAVQ